MSLNPINYYNPIITLPPPDQNPTSAHKCNQHVIRILMLMADLKELKYNYIIYDYFSSEVLIHLLAYTELTY
jgi:hypothetical protein